MKTPLIDLSRTIAFQRSFVTITGSINSALMLSQAVYWTPRAGKDGWFYKSTKEWEAESGLTTEQQKLARKKLTAAGFFEEKREEGSAIFFRVNLDAVENALREAMTPPGNQTPREILVPPHGKPEGTPRETLNASKEQRLPETTTETTAQEPLALVSPPDQPAKLPGNLTAETWQAFKRDRKTRKIPISEYAERLLLKKLEKLVKNGESAEAIVQQSIELAYRGVFPLRIDQAEREKLKQRDTETTWDEIADKTIWQDPERVRRML